MLDSLIAEHPDLILGFQDEAGVYIQARTARVWSRGKPVRRMNADHVMVSVYGFYPINGNPAVMTSGTGKAEDMCRFLDAVRSANGDRKIVMILDNSKPHHSHLVSEHAVELDIVLLFLPPYSPQFNPIEFIWKTMKKLISQHFILDGGTLADFIRKWFMDEAAKESYFQGWKRHFLMENNSKTLG